MLSTMKSLFLKPTFPTQSIEEAMNLSSRLRQTPREQTYKTLLRTPVGKFNIIGCGLECRAH